MIKIIRIIILIFIIFTTLNAYVMKEVRINDLNFKIYTHCSQVLHDYNQTKCYSYKNHAPRFNMYYIDSNVLKTYKKRLTFRQDNRIPYVYQNHKKCYIKSKKDRGHLDPDANEDYNLKILKTTYLMSNVVPESPYQNRVLIGYLEKLERKFAIEYNGIIVITGAHFSNKHLKNNNECANIPLFIYKIFLKRKNNKFKIFKLYIIYDDKIYLIKSKRKIKIFLNLENLVFKH